MKRCRFCNCIIWFGDYHVYCEDLYEMVKAISDAEYARIWAPYWKLKGGKS